MKTNRLILLSLIIALATSGCGTLRETEDAPKPSPPAVIAAVEIIGMIVYFVGPWLQQCH